MKQGGQPSLPIRPTLHFEIFLAINCYSDYNTYIIALKFLKFEILYRQSLNRYCRRAKEVLKSQQSVKHCVLL